MGSCSRRWLSLSVFVWAFAASASFAVDFDELSPLDAWAGIPSHPAKVNSVTKDASYVNGTPIARNHPYCGSSKFEITELVKPGEPVTVICGVCNLRPTRRGCAATCNHWGGIYRDVELEATPQTFIDDVWVRGDYDDRKAEAHVAIGGEVERWNGGKVWVSVEDVTVESQLKHSILKQTSKGQML